MMMMMMMLMMMIYDDDDDDDDDGNEIRLELNTWGYDMTDPDVEVPMTKKTITRNPFLVLH